MQEAVEYAAQPDHLVGHAPLLQGLGDGGDLGAGAAQDRHLGVRAPPLLHEGGDGARLLERVL